MKSHDSQVKGPAGKASLIKCKRSKSTSSDSEAHSSTHTSQQSRPDSHSPHATTSNEMSTVRFEQSSESTDGSGTSNITATSNGSTGCFYTPNKLIASAASTHGTTPGAASSIVAHAATPPNPTTIIASAIPHRTRHPSLNSTLSRFSLRRLLSPFGESNQTSPAASS